MSELPGYNYNDATAAADYIGARIKSRPDIAILAGTGLGDIAGGLQGDAALDYRDIPRFPVSTVPSHFGRLVYGNLNGRPLVVLQGRFHLYEGYSPRQVTFPIRVLQALGVRYLVLTNAAGGLNPEFAPGDIMLIRDHINLTGANPLIGPNDDRWGPRFTSMVHAYDDRLQNIVQAASRMSAVNVRTGVYAGLTGPSLETPAEMRFLRVAGADAVGFSTVMEAIAAAHAGMRVAGLSVITNMCLPDESSPSTVDEIIAVAQAAAGGLGKLLSRVIEGLDKTE